MALMRLPREIVKPGAGGKADGYLENGEMPERAPKAEAAPAERDLEHFTIFQIPITHIQDRGQEAYVRGCAAR
ncbi:hypothetical protein GL279_02240 [Paracoccus limosus]|jgi:hypothetical protein|uniref:Uncharacterized protein n=1 Tax=Paracoccus limosus TaxID=913252 RepID=A0A844H071_9RHOB|nr:hypothetical protein [Paracoccus limosus]MTH33415.1 hypothetical protein [Paracoccus limosus]